MEELTRIVLRNLVESPAPNRDIVAHLPCSLASSRMSLISCDSVRSVIGHIGQIARISPQLQQR